MNFNLLSGDITKERSDCVILGLYTDKQLTPQAEAVDKASGGYLTKLINRGEIAGKLKQSLLLQNIPQLNYERVLLIGLGPKDEFKDNHYIKAITVAIKRLKESPVTEVLCTLTGVELPHRDTAWKIRQAVLATRSVLYKFEQLKTTNGKAPSMLNQVRFLMNSAAEQNVAQAAILQGVSIANGCQFTKDLANLPANVCTPTYIAEQAKALHKEYSDIKVSVLDEKQMEKLGMHSLLCVGRGSNEPSKLITLEYYGADKSERPVALVGKGVTFDSGGISIKPSSAMDEMKYDMCGAASVLGTLRAIAEMKLPINVVGVIPSTENLPSGTAIKPGDIVTSLSGQTIEILNTDAEGRLILCDALTYAKEFNPAVVIDIATLTGAVIIALGHDVTGVFANNDEVANDIVEASKESCDSAWHMPLWDNYQELLDSNFADMQNIGNRTAGSITAACFLSRFTKDMAWAHLDVAGTAFIGGKEKGATARPVPLLTQYLMNRCQKT